jgi:hypothetical protein
MEGAMAIPKRVSERITQQLKRYQSILSATKNRDASEADTVTLITDILTDVLGYDKYSEITREFAIRNTFVDLAVKVGPEVRFLIEAKAIGVPLKDNHVKQAIDYGANQGIEWVILTNGVNWRVYKIHFKQPVDRSLVSELDLLEDGPRAPHVIECFGNLSREVFAPSAMTEFLQQQQATSKFSLAAFLLGDRIVSELRREVRRVYPGLRIEEEDLRSVLREEVIKRDLVDSDEAAQAKAALKRAAKASEQAKLRAREAPASPVLQVGPGAPQVTAASQQATAPPTNPGLAVKQGA